MSAQLRSALFTALRILVACGAMAWILSGVTIRDWATLADGERVEITNWLEVEEDPRFDQPGERGAIVLDTPDGRAALRVADLAVDKRGDPKVQIGIRSAWRSSRPGLLLIALLIGVPTALVQSLRFTWLTRAQEIDLSLWEGVKLVYAGNFLNFVALGSTGGDVFKAYYVSTHTDRKTEAVTAVFLDRAVGLAGLIILSALVMPFRFQDPQIRGLWPLFAALGLGLVGATFVAFSRRARRQLRVDAIIARLPFSATLQRIDAATHRMRHHPRLLGAALLLTLVLHSLALASLTVAAVGLGMNSGWELYPGYVTYLAVALLVAAIPISYQGLGTMDGVLQIFLRGTYGSYTQILFLGLLVRIFTLVWALPGFLVPLLGAHRPSPEKLAELEARSQGGV